MEDRMKAVEDGIGPNASAPALLAKKEFWCDVYVGTADDLVRAGLARIDMFPGQPGRGKIQCSFDLRDISGSHCGAGRFKLVIRRRGQGRFEVQWPVGEEEGKRRHEAFEADLAKRRAEPATSAGQPSEGELRGAMFFSLGRAFTRAYEASPARFNVGDRATYCSSDGARAAVEIVGAFDEYNVTDGGGFRLGYAVRDDDGQRFFAAAHHLIGDDNRVRHLMLAHGGGRAAPQVKQEDGTGRWL
jgi:hypothetical protein